jgi:hypothetical protein
MEKNSSGITLVLLLVTSCSPSFGADLTRPQAKVLLSKTRTFNSLYNRLWFVLPNGGQVFEEAGGVHNPEFAKVIVVSPAMAMLTLTTPVPAHLDEVTGIADAGAPGIKEVLFRWSYTNVPEVLKPYAVVGGPGRATMRLYDDGWRVAGEPELSYNTAAPILSAAQQHQMDLFKEAERTRLQGLQRDLQREVQRRKESFEASKIPTRDILTTVGLCEVGNGVGGYKHVACGKYTVTDVSVVVERPPTKEVVWFGNIFDLKKNRNGADYFILDCVQQGSLPNLRIGFFTENERNAFSAAIASAHEAWFAKYSKDLPK